MSEPPADPPSEPPAGPPSDPPPGSRVAGGDGEETQAAGENAGNGSSRGASAIEPTPRGAAAEPAPAEVRELAEACVRFVERTVGVRPDYQPETLPLVDHWLREGRAAISTRPETVPLIAHAAGAYFGEVVRRRHGGWWRTDAPDPASWRVELREVFLSFCPVDVARDALGLDRGPDDELLEATSFDLDDDDREAVATRLAELPEVDEEEYRAPSTRLEVLDIVIDAIRRKQAADDQPPLALEPEDYGPTVH